MNSQKVFISYASEENIYNDWVKAFADRLRTDGIDVVLDQYDLQLGDRLTQFMETAVTEAEYVIILITKNYTEKADARTGGVGFETDLVTSDILVSGKRRKFIPIFIMTDFNEAPRFLRGVKGLQITNLFDYDKQYGQLYETLTNQRPQKPALGAIRHIGNAMEEEPFDIALLRSKMRKNIEPYYYLDIRIDVRSLSEYSTAEIYDLLRKHILIQDSYGYKPAMPRIFTPAYKQQHSPEVVFESNDLHPTTTNVGDFERLILLHQQLTYAYIEFYENRPYSKSPYMELEPALETLEQLIVILGKIHSELNREPEIAVTAKTGSNIDIKIIGSRHPFSLANSGFSEEYEHKSGVAISKEIVLTSLQTDDAERLFNRILEIFESNRSDSQNPFLRVDHDSFVVSYDAFKGKFGSREWNLY